MGQPGDPYDPNPALPPVPAYPPPGQYPAPYAGQYPQYPQYPQYAQYPGYPPMPYAGYPPPYRPSRPGVATAANVLCFVAAGLLIAAGLLLFFGASIVSSFDDTSVVTAELVLDGIINMVAAGLLIAGAVSFGGRRPGGRVMLSVGCGIVLGEAVYWIARGHQGGYVFWALVFSALVIVSLSLAWSSSSNQWIRG